MVVHTNDNTYYVSWMHNWKGDELNPPSTLCDITRKTIDNGMIRYSVVSTGLAKMYFKDKQFKKDLGRKISMTKALKKLFPSSSQKHFRFVFWNTYLLMRNDKW